MGHVPRDSPAFESLHRALEEAPAVHLPLQTNEPSLKLSEKAPTVMERAPNPMQDSKSHNAFPPSEPVKHSRTEKMGKLKSPVHPVTSPPRFPPLIKETPVCSSKRSAPSGAQSSMCTTNPEAFAPSGSQASLSTRKVGGSPNLRLVKEGPKTLYKLLRVSARENCHVSTHLLTIRAVTVQSPQRQRHQAMLF